MAYVVIAHYRADEGARTQVRAALQAMIEPSRAEPGNLRYEVAVDPADPAVFAIYEKYRDEAAFDAHTRSPHFDRWLREQVLPNLAERTRHDLVEVTG